MHRCLQLAKLGEGNVAPNPKVGALLLYNNRIIGEGFHQKYGEAHAEVNCINAVLKNDKPFICKSTLFVSLEPCSHFGKTPPCVDLIIKQKISKVIIGCTDSFESVNGKGIEKLLAAGIKVDIGILQKECRTLNKHFFTFNEKQRPYVILKWAQTNDRFIAANNNQLKISHHFTDKLMHKYRTEAAAILVGYKTILSDNPNLTARLWNGKNPTRVIIDLHNKLENWYNIFNDNATTIIINTTRHLKKNNIFFCQINHKLAIVPQILKCLFELKITSLIVEGGASTLQHFIDDNYWDEAVVITNEHLSIKNEAVGVKNNVSSPILKNELLVNTKHIFSDRIDFFKQQHNEFL